MKIAVVNPPWDGTRAGSRWPTKSPFRGYIPYPIHLASGASCLRAAGHEVLFLDAIARRMRLCDTNPFIERLQQFGPGLIIQEISTPSIVDDMAIAERMAKFAPVAVCGPHATHYASRMLDDYPFLHSVLQGEIERNSVNLAASMLEAVYGFDAARDLDEYPDMAQENLYLYRDVPGKHGGITYQTWASRGCVWKCSFCIEPWRDTGRPSWRIKSPSRVVAEVVSAHRKFPLLDGVYFDGPTENVRDGRCLELAERLLDVNIPFAMMTRVDTLEISTWETMVKCGLYYIKAGMESANQKLVDDCGKKLDLGKVTETVRALKQWLPPRHIHLTCMFGLPGETRETVHETLSFLKNLGVYWQESYMAPTPGTGYWSESEFPLDQLALAGQEAPGNPQVAEWVREVKQELGL